MTTVSRDRLKQKGIKRFLKSFGYSVEGLKYAYKYEQSFTIHFFLTIGAIALGLILKISITEWLVITVLIGLIMAAELINTSIEAVVDLTTNKIHPLAKIAKDTASAAVFMLCLSAIATALFVFLPKILSLFKL